MITTVDELTLNVTVLVAEFQVPPVTVGVEVRSDIAPLAVALTVNVLVIAPVRLKVNDDWRATLGTVRRGDRHGRGRGDVVVDDRDDAEAVADRESAGGVRQRDVERLVRLDDGVADHARR